MSEDENDGPLLVLSDLSGTRDREATKAGRRTRREETV